MSVVNCCFLEEIISTQLKPSRQTIEAVQAEIKAKEAANTSANAEQRGAKETLSLEPFSVTTRPIQIKPAPLPKFSVQSTIKSTPIRVIHQEEAVDTQESLPIVLNNR